MAVGFDEPVLGNTWWALQTALTAEQEQVLLLWLNSTPALLLLLSRRVSTRSAWMQVKKPAWAAMPVLDVRALPAETLATLARAYERLADEPLEALAKLHDDPTRAAIDTALGGALGWPEAKDKIWSIAATMAAAQPAPEIRLDLVAYRDRDDDYVTRVVDLTKDLDGLHAELMQLQA
ncbi:hypothetical protein Atep_08600 [Allochromatium tepidum]|uniref:Uncharacterized protein n=2 Tax=Allochromatium tepidum TaxID=553982 RepID=A0ABM7QKB9_9GAMM|nr:hypothetical protein Atep_08600 [Allochromatium tepidum]